MPATVTPRDLVLVGVGGAVGTALRVATTGAVDDGAFPLGTLAVNLLGALLLGVVVSAVASGEARLLLGTGVLGGFTTYSAVALELEWLLREDAALAVAYALATVAGGYVLSLVGLALGRTWRP